MLSLHPRSASLPVMTWDNSVHVEHAFRSPLSDMAFVFVSVAFNCIRFKPDIDVHVGQHLSRGAKTPLLTNASAFRAWHSTSLACGPDLRVHVELGIQRSSLTRNALRICRACIACEHMSFTLHVRRGIPLFPLKHNIRVYANWASIWRLAFGISKVMMGWFSSAFERDKSLGGPQGDLWPVPG